ncbi:hypothetical protein BHAOGJBA_3944 [Methylobacterium hispanicum]|jgi:hypothetical protein|uniref:Uncharacterized protein n=1 Tax=Methylobacterium hispanicum TaxID=270350 RepID=A0AAV4ZS49_9HYPH|nr:MULTISPECIES: hypothetical protein [Methylobacterium]GJD90405.1 hypothetical protein BHAOGJBA_3944 [Methylobacterium hispanicum]
MTLVLRSTAIGAVRRARVTVRLEPRNDVGARVVADAARYRSIGSLQALALAAAASLATTALLWLAL